jgi:hypothetical protein
LSVFALLIYGCRHCGNEERDHCQRWTDTVGWHGYTMPTEELIRSRINIAKQAAAAAPSKES